MRTAILLLLVPALLLAQSYYEASGITEVFTLKAGAKAGPTVVHAMVVTQPSLAIHAAFRNGQLRITGGVPGMVKIFRLNGREVGAWQVSTSGVISIGHLFSTDVYLFRYEAKGLPVKTFKLLVGWKGDRL